MLVSPIAQGCCCAAADCAAAAGAPVVGEPVEPVDGCAVEVAGVVVVIEPVAFSVALFVSAAFPVAPCTAFRARLIAPPICASAWMLTASMRATVTELSRSIAAIALIACFLFIIYNI
jgi:hypothetical protein